jgi:hypothetical protein
MSFNGWGATERGDIVTGLAPRPLKARGPRLTRSTFRVAEDRTVADCRRGPLET